MHIWLWLLFSSLTWAQTKSALTVVAWDGWPAFQKSVQYANQSLQANGYSVHNLSFSDDDGETYLRYRTGFQKMNTDAFAAIDRFIDKPSDSKVLYLVDHGTSIGHNLFGGDDSDYKKTGVKFPDESVLKFEDLSEHVKEKMGSKQHLKIIASQCFSGGVHQVAAENDNVCSLSATRKYDTYKMDTESMNAFDKSVMDKVRGKGSLLSAYASGLSADVMNGGTAELSSFYYAKSILEKKLEGDSELKLVTSVDEDFMQLKNAAEDTKGKRQPTFIFLQEVGSAKKCPENKQKNFDSLKKIQEMLARLDRIDEIHFNLTPEEYQALPIEHQKLYDAIVKINQPHFEEYKKSIKDKLKKMEELRDLWHRKEEAYSKCVKKQGEEFCNPLFEADMLATNSAIRDQVMKFKDQIPEIVKFSKMVGNLKILAHALREGSKSEVQKLKSLLACENEPL